MQIELSMNEYLKFKQRMNDLEVNNNLLVNQVRLLKQMLSKEVGTAKEIHKQMFIRKLEES